MARRRAFGVLLLVLLAGVTLLGGVDGKKKSKSKKTSIAPGVNLEVSGTEKTDKEKEEGRRQQLPIKPAKDEPYLAYGNNPLHDAARDGNKDLVRKIIDRVPGTFTDARFSKWDYDDVEDYPDFRDRNDAGNTPLMLAIFTNEIEIVEMLLDKGATVHLQNRAGNTPIMWAAKHNDARIVKLLIDRGADVNARDTHDYTPLHFCSFHNADVACKLLLDAGADVNAVNDNGQSAVFSAAEFHHPEVLKVLIDAGADVKIRDVHENGPVDLCSGRATTQGYTGEPHEVSTLEQLRAAGGRYHGGH